MILGGVAVSVYLLTERSLAAGLDERAASALSELVEGRAQLGEAVERVPSDAGALVLLLASNGTFPTTVEGLKLGYPNEANDTYILNRLPDSALQRLLDEGRLSVTDGSGENRLRVHAQLGTVPVFFNRPFSAAFF